jgi:hypothetical protein
MSLAPLQGHFHRMKLQFHRLDELLLFVKLEAILQGEIFLQKIYQDKYNY